MIIIMVTNMIITMIINYNYHFFSIENLKNIRFHSCSWTNPNSINFVFPYWFLFLLFFFLLLFPKVISYWVFLLFFHYCFLPIDFLLIDFSYCFFSLLIFPIGFCPYCFLLLFFSLSIFPIAFYRCVPQIGFRSLTKRTDMQIPY